MPLNKNHIKGQPSKDLRMKVDHWVDHIIKSNNDYNK